MLHLLTKILGSYRNVAVIITLRMNQLWKHMVDEDATVTVNVNGSCRIWWDVTR